MYSAGLVPFLGGLFIGGIGGAAFENNKNMNKNYMYTYPQNYVYYPPVVYQNMPINPVTYPPYYRPYNYVQANTFVEKNETYKVESGKNNRSLTDISNVPVYIYR